MKTTNAMLAPVKTRGDFRQLSAQSSPEGLRATEYPELDQDDPLWDLWDTMTEIYGHKWTSNNGDRPTWGWFHLLGELAVADLGVGITRCRERSDRFPPDASEFYRLCKPSTDFVTAQQMRNGQHDPHWIDRIPLTPDEARPVIDDIKQRLGLWE